MRYKVAWTILGCLATIPLSFGQQKSSFALRQQSMSSSREELRQKFSFGYRANLVQGVAGPISQSSTVSAEPPHNSALSSPSSEKFKQETFAESAEQPGRRRAGLPSQISVAGNAAAPVASNGLMGPLPNGSGRFHGSASAARSGIGVGIGTGWGSASAAASPEGFMGRMMGRQSFGFAGHTVGRSMGPQLHSPLAILNPTSAH